jgi:hypothetical protein
MNCTFAQNNFTVNVVAATGSSSSEEASGGGGSIMLSAVGSSKSMQLRKGIERAFIMNHQKHKINVILLEENTAHIAIDNQERIVLTKGIMQKIDLNQDGMFDLSITFKQKNAHAANIVLGYIQENKIKEETEMQKISEEEQKNQKISLFGGGLNFKPFVSIFDVVRSVEHFITNDFNKEIYHVVGENLTVLEIAETCKKYVPNLQIESTSNAIPNKGYTLSNEKIIETGFWFEKKIEQEIEKMIEKWRNKCQ